MFDVLSYILVLAFLLPLLGFEMLFRSRPKATIEPLTYQRSKWEIINESENKRTYECSLDFKNFSPKYEGTVVDLKTELQILFREEKKENIQGTVTIGVDKASREDGYIISFLVPPGVNKKTILRLDFSGDLSEIEDIHAVVIRINYALYDRTGYHPGKFTDIIFVPIQEAVQPDISALQEKGAMIYPVKTHLLTDQDDLAEVIKKYAGKMLKNGDIVVIAESPVAITQRRFVHPNDLKIGFWARRICYFVGSAGSLSSPCGMQCAINQLGLGRIMLAFLGGGLLKVFGKPGWFYTIAGIESELIDDLTGTIPPYDKYLVLGPENPEKFVNQLKEKTGVDIAIADANDLKRARIVASTLKDAENKIQNWMKNNPAGNSYEQTPIVVIRPENLEANKRNEYAQTSKI